MTSNERMSVVHGIEMDPLEIGVDVESADAEAEDTISDNIEFKIHTTPAQEVNMRDPAMPEQKPAHVSATPGNAVRRSTAVGRGGVLITVHGYMHKQGVRLIKAPIPKSWKRRYFALENSKIYYFQGHLECRQYFTTRNVELVVGAIEVKDALQLCPCSRLDLPHRGFEVKTKNRNWILCPETDEEYSMWFEALEMAIVSSGGNVLERQLPNVREYPMKGIATYHLFYYLFILSGLLEIFGLLFWFVIGFQPCDNGRQDADCATILTDTLDSLTCGPLPVNGYFTVPLWWLEIANVSKVECFHQPPIGQWISYFCLLVAELLSFTLAALYYLGMWNPVRRGACYLNEFQPALPDKQWPKVDVFICHYSEPAEETIETLAAALALEYPPELLHIWVLDDGYCKAKWKKGNAVPFIELNKGVIESAGDLRQEIAQFLFDKVCDPNEDIEVYAWRKLHSSANLPSSDRPRVVNRSDCAIGSFRDDYIYKGLPKVSFIGRVKPIEHFSKAGNINNCLYNEGADGKYACIFDNDMQPHPKFILATLPFFFDDASTNKTMPRHVDHQSSSNANSVIDMAESHPYSDAAADNGVAFVQTPQYFRDCVALQLGDPLGHRNSTFYDAIQTGQDGYACASFAGTNAIFRREALDSVAGIQYGSLTEDAYTGQCLSSLGWKNLYFRKDFEGEPKDRIRLAEGLVPESVAASLAQRKRWAKGNFQIFLKQNRKLIDPNWVRPEVALPPKKGSQHLAMKKIFIWNNTIYPLGSFPALLFYYITLYFLFTGLAPIYLGGLRLLFGLVPKLFIQGVLSALSNRTVDNDDVVRSQEAWFAYAFAHCCAVIETIWWKITGKDPKWANTGGIQRGALSELPNVLVFFGLSAGIIWSVVRFFAAYNSRQFSHGASLLLASLLMGLYIATKLAGIVRMSIQEYFGWSYFSLTDHGNFLGSSSLALGLSFIAIWVYIEQPSSNPF